jgi:hypothetical protein
MISFNFKGRKNRPWYEELELTESELPFLKRLMGIAQRYQSIFEVEYEFYEAFEANGGRSSAKTENT